MAKCCICTFVLLKNRRVAIICQCIRRAKNEFCLDLFCQKRQSFWKHNGIERILQCSVKMMPLKRTGGLASPIFRSVAPL